MSSNRQNKQPKAIPSIAIFSDLESYVIQYRLAFQMLITKMTTETRPITIIQVYVITILEIEKYFVL